LGVATQLRYWVWCPESRLQSLRTGGLRSERTVLTWSLDIKRFQQWWTKYNVIQARSHVMTSQCTSICHDT
jgi:hypothetical protein